MVHGAQHILQGLHVARHLQAHVEPFGHAQLAHDLIQAAVGDIDGPGRAHLGGQVEAVVVHIRNDDKTGTHVPCDRRRHDADGPGACDQHILAHHVEGQGRMGGIAERVEDRRQLIRYVVGQRKSVDRRQA